MQLRWLLLCFAIFPLVGRAIDRDEEHTFKMQPDCGLKVDLYRGAIEVRETDGDEITVVAHLSLFATTEEKADRLRAALGLEVKQEGNTVVVRASDPVGRGVTLSWNEKPTVDLECKIFVPRKCSVELRTRDGGITVGNLTGRVVARTTQGNVFLRRIDGTVDVVAQSGDVIVSRCSGEMNVSTAKGTIRVGTLQGRSILKNSGGDIEVLEVHAELEAEADVGDITVGFPDRFAGDAKIRTAYGNIFAKIDPKANCAVQASSFWGHVDNKLPLTIQTGGNGKGKLTGRLNDGGPILSLRANGGHVFLQRGDTYFN